MRHRVRGRKFNRTASHRAALMNSLATSLLKHKRIKTTEAKAKEARGFVEAIITKARRNDLHARRLIMRKINDKEVINELFNEIIPKIGDRPGGYTRVVKLGNRMGDAAGMAILELVDYNDVINKKVEERKDKKEAKREAKETKKAAEQPDEIEEAKVVEEKVDEKKVKKEAKKTKKASEKSDENKEAKVVKAKKGKNK
jgi:large subunit ribosomal protein L17